MPVAGNDRMRLGEQLAVMDLIAFGQFLLLPEDDFNLAVLLKSPLLGLDEEALFDLAARRGERSLWGELQRRARIRRSAHGFSARPWPAPISCRPMNSMPICWAARRAGANCSAASGPTPPIPSRSS